MEQNNYIFFDKYIERFIKANILRLNALKEEAFLFIKNVSSKYKIEI